MKTKLNRKKFVPEYYQLLEFPWRSENIEPAAVQPRETLVIADNGSHRDLSRELLATIWHLWAGTQPEPQWGLLKSRVPIAALPIFLWHLLAPRTCLDPWVISDAWSLAVYYGQGNAALKFSRLQNRDCLSLRFPPECRAQDKHLKVCSLFSEGIPGPRSWGLRRPWTQKWWCSLKLDKAEGFPQPVGRKILELLAV